MKRYIAVFVIVIMAVYVSIAKVAKKDQKTNQR